MHTLPNLPETIAREVFATLCGLLPAPAIDTPETRADRDELAMASVAAMKPTNAFEANLAAHIVGALAHAKDSFRLAGRPGAEPKDILRCRAQAIAMGRQALTMYRTLLSTRPRLATPQPAAPLTHPAPPPQPQLDHTKLTEVEKYAATYPDRAARIRAAGGLPTPCDFDPPRHSLVRAIVTSNSPILRALDQFMKIAA